MRPIRRLRTWWQIQTGEEETPFDGEVFAWFISLSVHLAILVVLAALLLHSPKPQPELVLETILVEEEPPIHLPEEFVFTPTEQEKIGANSLDGSEAAEAFAQVEEETLTSELDTLPEPIPLLDEGQIVINNDLVEISKSLEKHAHLNTRGEAGVGVRGAEGAIDRITKKILESLNGQKTMVVWLFDQSVSLSAQRKGIHSRLDRIYKELGVIEASYNPAFAKHADKPLLTSVVAFGEDINFITSKPTDQLVEIKSAVRQIPVDRSGKEQVFSAVHQVARRYKSYTQGKDPRKVLIVVFTDEAGDDGVTKSDPAIEVCRRFAMPVYVVGIPAPFGRSEVEVKWVDPDPKYDQTPQWTNVTQGPESLMPERVKLAFSGANRRREEPLDSGFGPFALTRLAVETGGIYYSVHASRNINRAVSRRETSHLSAYLKHFFDPKVMRRYRPDYVTAGMYKKRLRQNRAKLSLVNASSQTWLDPMARPKLRFRKRSDAALAQQLSEAQKMAASLEPKIIKLYEELRLGERAREKLTQPRWQAGYDLAMGRVQASMIRTVGYNRMLARAKQGMKFQNPKSDTWDLRPSDNVSSGSDLSKKAAAARVYLERVVKDHPGTPWAYLAAKELKQPLGWEWQEAFTNVNPPAKRQPGNNNPRRTPRDEKRRMLTPKKEKRQPPKI